MQRDILLVPFPFSDQSGKKVRPVVVLSNREFNEHSEDYLVAGITSNLSREKYSLALSNSDLESGTLFSRCCIRGDNLLKLDRGLVLKKIGTLKKEKFGETVKLISSIISIDK